MDKSKFELLWLPNVGASVICTMTEDLPEGGFKICTWASKRQSTSLATLHTFALHHWIEKHSK